MPIPQYSDAPLASVYSPLLAAGEIEIGLKRDRLQFHPSELVLAQAHGHYAKVYLWREEQLNTHMVYIRMKQLVSLLCDWPNIVHCHRGFVINLDFVAAYRGGTQNFRLLLGESLPQVCVSRDQATDIKARLNKAMPAKKLKAWGNIGDSLQ